MWVMEISSWRSTGSQSGDPLLSSAWPPTTEPELWSLTELRSLLLLHTHVRACVRACVFTLFQSGGWQARLHLAGQSVSCLCPPFLKALAECFQSSATVLQRCCWSAQTAGNGITPRGSVRERSVVFMPNRPWCQLCCLQRNTDDSIVKENSMYILKRWKVLSQSTS